MNDTPRKNPFRTIRVAAATVGVIACVGFFAYVVCMSIAKSIEDFGAEVLWQVPLVFAVFIGIVVLFCFICSVIAKMWNKAEQNYDRKDVP